MKEALVYKLVDAARERKKILENCNIHYRKKYRLKKSFTIVGLAATRQNAGPVVEFAFAKVRYKQTRTVK
jgi:hypothetical protein